MTAMKSNKIDFKYNLKIYFGLLKKYKFLFFIVLFLVLLMEGINVLEKFLFKQIVDRGTEFSLGTLAKPEFVHILLILALVFGIMAFSKAIFKWFHIHCINRLESRLIVDLKRKLFNHMIYLSHHFHTTHKTGSLISRLTRGGRAIERMTDLMVFNAAPLIFQLVVVSFSLIYFDRLSALIIFSTVIFFILYSFIHQKIQETAYVKANDAEDFEKGNIADIFTNIDSIKYFGKEDYIKNKFLKLTEDTKKATLKNWDYFRWFDSVQNLILGMGTFTLIYFSINKFLVGSITLGTLIFIYTVYGTLVGPLWGFTWGMREFYNVMADFESLFEYYKIDNEIKNKPNAEELKIKNGSIEFRNMSFNYGKRKIFENFNLKIKPNQKVALVGHSGCGKSTLVKLLYRFYDISNGKILIDGKDIINFNQESLRTEMGIVPQECVLFDETIYNNILFSRPNATKQEVFQAMKFAQLDKIIETFPNKENTIVGERGVKLSGGEKQRVSIARAILADKKVLVLDEATSSLDSKIEHDIQEDLQKLMMGRTSIIIAHRLSTIMKADMIVVMKKGQIVQMGKHSQLIKKAGEYRKLWNLQRGGYIK